MTKQDTVKCLNCGRSEEDFPVIVLRLAGREVHICPQCLPALIHHPDQITTQLIAAGWQNEGTVVKGGDRTAVKAHKGHH